MWENLISPSRPNFEKLTFLWRFVSAFLFKVRFHILMLNKFSSGMSQQLLSFLLEASCGGLSVSVAPTTIPNLCIDVTRATLCIEGCKAEKSD